MKTARFPAIVLLLTILCLSGCLGLATLSSSHPIVSSIYVSGSTVYTAGWCSNGSTTIACFWTNGSRTDLPGEGGIARSIFVSGDTVYVAGFVGDTPCFWTNGSRTDLPTGKKSGWANSIFVSGNTVYVAGCTSLPFQFSPCYWTNGTRTDLADFGTADSIFVSGNTVYVSGCKEGMACYWANGVKTDLPCDGQRGYQYGLSIHVFEDVVYVSGRYASRSLFQTKAAACYWTNGIRTDLPGNDAEACSVYVAGQTVYTAGCYDWKGFNSSGTDAVPCYWKNSTKIDLAGGRGAASSIFVSDGTIYIAGHLKDTACYWVNGVRVDLH